MLAHFVAESFPENSSRPLPVQVLDQLLIGKFRVSNWFHPDTGRQSAKIRQTYNSPTICVADDFGALFRHPLRNGGSAHGSLLLLILSPHFVDEVFLMTSFCTWDITTVTNQLQLLSYDYTSDDANASHYMPRWIKHIRNSWVSK